MCTFKIDKITYSKRSLEQPMTIVKITPPPTKSRAALNLWSHIQVSNVRIRKKN